MTNLDEDDKRDIDLRTTQFAPKENEHLNERNNHIVPRFAPGQSPHFFENPVQINDQYNPGEEYAFPYWEEYTSADENRLQ
jgi:hypothetical protein